MRRRDGEVTRGQWTLLPLSHRATILLQVTKEEKEACKEEERREAR
ncbi:hypothetical protein E2C01_086301 [Portunus trituberculatus]|uniref:Uncharacterized protein n=1 Tax=Portunus trituberculatus TaxID=210409 RepID=A0A5B7JD31_PORTR|nr:hypothetical protein [Portunus trituberculatus]